jgi:hypothetical protein
MHAGPGGVTQECLLCHWREPVAGDVVYTFQSGTEDGQGCRGCHGRESGSPGGWGAGMRRRHDALLGGICGDCHAFDPEPPDESVLPFYYGLPGVAVGSPCATSPAQGGEDWNGDGRGLDNDGDGLYDADDPDCTLSSIGDGTGDSSWGRAKASYR